MQSQSFTHASDGGDTFRSAKNKKGDTSFGVYDHSHLDWGVALDTIDLLKLDTEEMRHIKEPSK